MGNSFETLDYIIFGVYALIIVGVGLWVSRDKKGHKKDANDYFLASKSLPWWAIGASLIAANISAEQFIGMSGSGFAMGLAIASYEWMAALTLIIVGKYFLPVFIEKGLYTIPEFIEKRYSTHLKSILAIFWVALFIFVNLTSVLFLGGKALNVVLGVDTMTAIICLALFAAAYSLWGGLSAVAWTDVIQVALLVVGGLITTFIALSSVTPEGGFFAGLQHIYEQAPDHFHMILDKSNPEYMNLPGIAVLVGGLWVANLYYWGFNQYIIQRTLAAKSLKESQRGIVFAAFLKMIIPLIVVVPGIVAYVLYQGGEGTAIIDGVQTAFSKAGGGLNNDNAYPWLISTFVPTGLKGLVVAALAAAIVSSLASMLNSTATIFTMDIYKQNFNKSASQSSLVKVGRISATISLIIAVLIAPMLGNIDQMFQYIQEYTGLVSPGILAVFIMGLFYKKATNKGAIWGIILSAFIAFYFKIGPNNWVIGDMAWLFPTLPWMHQMMITWILSMIIIAIISNYDGKGKASPKAIIINNKTFETGKNFNIASFIIIILLAFLYAMFW
ncbi:SSS family solute:Na+ symporter [Balneicella halophila]|uniref:SSS family solute:Na+ symporter n=1 Tax=Balneicella halophila TaxID=1537566 RepID=A0A7L4UQD6_BALHA|nr:sodium/sugar symporter [Balneicella halophila]PVX51026.1 SSS family solute:Na+ symporter [Balneicella halophila]